jgi:hypothetical protein
LVTRAVTPSLMIPGSRQTGSPWLPKMKVTGAGVAGASVGSCGAAVGEEAVSGIGVANAHALASILTEAMITIMVSKPLWRNI